MNLSDNHLDDLIREKLTGFTPEPPAGLWNRIQEELDKKRKVRKVIFYRWAGAAAVLLIAFVSGILNLPDKEVLPGKNLPGNTSAIRQETQLPTSAPEATIPTHRQKQFTEAKMQSIKPPQQGKKGVPPSATSKEREFHPSILAITDRGYDRQILLISAGNEITLVFAPQNAGKMAYNSGSIAQTVTEKAYPETWGKSNASPEWKIGIQLAPGYISRSAEYSTAYARNLSSAGSAGQTSVDGGITVTMKASRRWRLESGLYYSRNEISQNRNSRIFATNSDYNTFTTADKSFYSNLVSVQNGKMEINSAAGIIRIDQIPEQATLVSRAESAIGMNTALLTTGNFSQIFDFLEFPISARYRIYDGEIDIDLQSGFSANFIIGNQVYLTNGSQRDYVGKTSDINHLGFSGIAGLGFNYPLSKKMAIAIEPRVSYWLNSLNNSGEVTFRPWKIGVYSGITFGL